MEPGNSFLLIEAYLNNELSDTEKEEFEGELHLNEDFKYMYLVYKKLYYASENNDISGLFSNIEYNKSLSPECPSIYNAQNISYVFVKNWLPTLFSIVLFISSG